MKCFVEGYEREFDESTKHDVLMRLALECADPNTDVEELTVEFPDDPEGIGYRVYRGRFSSVDEQPLSSADTEEIKLVEAGYEKEKLY